MPGWWKTKLLICLSCSVKRKEQHQRMTPLGIHPFRNVWPSPPVSTPQDARGCCTSWQAWCPALCSWSCSAALCVPAAWRPWSWSWETWREAGERLTDCTTSPRSECKGGRTDDDEGCGKGYMTLKVSLQSFWPRSAMKPFSYEWVPVLFNSWSCIRTYIGMNSHTDGAILSSTNRVSLFYRPAGGGSTQNVSKAQRKRRQLLRPSTHGC